MLDWEALLIRIYAEEDKVGWFRRNSYFVDILYHRYKVSRDPAMRQYYDFVLKGYSGSIWELQQQRLITLRDLVQSHGGRLLVVTFPFMHNMGPNYEFKNVHDQLNQFWTGLNVPHLDLLPVFKDLPPSKITVNRYDAHPNEYAHALAAQSIDQFLWTL